MGIKILELLDIWFRSTVDLNTSLESGQVALANTPQQKDIRFASTLQESYSCTLGHDTSSVNTRSLIRITRLPSSGTHSIWKLVGTPERNVLFPRVQASTAVLVSMVSRKRNSPLHLRV